MSIKLQKSVISNLRKASDHLAKALDAISRIDLSKEPKVTVKRKLKAKGKRPGRPAKK